MELARVEAETTEQLVQRLAADLSLPGCRRDVPTVLREQRSQVFLPLGFDPLFPRGFVSERCVNALVQLRLLPNIGREIPCAHGVAVAEDDGSLDRVPQLTNVAWPLIPLEQTQRLGRNLDPGFAGRAGEFLQEVEDEQRDVTRTIAQGGERDVDDIQAIEQVLTEAPLLGLGGK